MDEKIENKLKYMKEGSMPLRILGNLLFIPIKILFIPLIAVFYIISISFNILGNYLLTILSVIGIAVVIIGITLIINDPNMRLMNISILLLCSFIFTTIFFIIKIMPQAFAVFSGTLIYFLKVWL